MRPTRAAGLGGLRRLPALHLLGQVPQPPPCRQLAPPTCGRLPHLGALPTARRCLTYRSHLLLTQYLGRLED